MKMIMAVVPRKSGDDVLTLLINSGYTATYLETQGGMLRQSQLTIFIAVRTSELPKVLDIISSSCSGEIMIHRGVRLAMPSDINEPHLANEGKKLGHSSAVVFVWSLDPYELP